MREIKFRIWDPFQKAVTPLKYMKFPVEELEGFILMQFTGLHDKNGKEIYGGDCLRYVDPDGLHTVYGVVKFGEIPDCRKHHQGFYIEWVNDGENRWNDWWGDEMIENKLQLGTLVQVTQVWERRKWPIRERGHWNDIQWERKDANLTGVVCGVRKLHNGYSEGGGEEQIEFKATSHEDAYLIAVNHARTIYAPADAVAPCSA